MDPEKHRVIGTNHLLAPNLSSAYGIDDIRSLSAVYPDRYIRFVKEFLDEWVIDRYTAYWGPGGGMTRFIDNPILDMANVKYLLMETDIRVIRKWTTIRKILKDRPFTPVLRQITFLIEGIARPVLFQHPPSEISYEVEIKKPSFLRFYLALHPRVWSEEKGDGVLFEVYAQDGKDRVPLFSRWVDPKRNKKDRRWIESKVDLSRFSGKKVKLIFKTSGGKNTPSQYRLVYDKEIKIYENLRAFPRAFVVHQAKFVTGEGAVIKAMKGQDFNPKELVIIEGDVNSPPLSEIRDKLATPPVQRDSSAEIINYEETSVQIRAKLKRPGFLILSDTYYPGWKAFVGDKEVPIYRANYIFRGVFLGPGQHIVRFIYRPLSFKVGLLITCLTLIAGSIIYAFWGLRKGTMFFF
jgi:hypothetical protein